MEDKLPLPKIGPNQFQLLLVETKKGRLVYPNGEFRTDLLDLDVFDNLASVISFIEILKIKLIQFSVFNGRGELILKGWISENLEVEYIGLKTW